jgi:hypothetical protein
MAFRLCNKDRMLKPGRCLICETHPGHRVVDTGYNLNSATVFDKLRGRKYICSGCGEKIGKALGMANQSIVNGVKESLIKEQNRNAELLEQLDVQKKIAELTEYLTESAKEVIADVEVEESDSTGAD